MTCTGISCDWLFRGCCQLSVCYKFTFSPAVTLIKLKAIVINCMSQMCQKEVFINKSTTVILWLHTVGNFLILLCLAPFSRQIESTDTPKTQTQCTVPHPWKQDFNYMAEWCLSNPTKGRSGWLGWKRRQGVRQSRETGVGVSSHTQSQTLLHTNTQRW